MVRAIILSLLIFLQFDTTHGQPVNSLRVGDPAPTFHPYKWIKGESVEKFEKGHVYVIEFGSTWCAPCIAMIPHLSALSEKYQEKLTLISVFVMEENQEPVQTKDPKYVSGVESFISKRGDQVNYRVAVDGPDKFIEKSWLRAAGKNGIPFTFIIDKNGMISAVTIGIGNIQKAIDVALSTTYDLTLQVDEARKTEAAKVPWDYHKLMLIDGNGGRSDDFIYRSVISKYNGDIPKYVFWYVSSPHWAKPGSDDYLTRGMFQSTGMALADMYRLAYADTLTPYPTFRFKGKWVDTLANPNTRSAYGRFWYDPIIDVHDFALFRTGNRTSDNRYNYSTKVPLEKSSAKLLQQIMRSDLNNYFGYDVVVEERMMPCWNVVLLPGAEVALGAASPGSPYRDPMNDDIPGYPRRLFTNASIRDVILVLSTMYGFGAYTQGIMPAKDIAPFFDETHYSGELDFNYEPPFSKSFEEFRKHLNTKGIDVVKGTRKMKVIVIRDRS